MIFIYYRESRNLYIIEGVTHNLSLFQKYTYPTLNSVNCQELEDYKIGRDTQ